MLVTVCEADIVSVLNTHPYPLAGHAEHVGGQAYSIPRACGVSSNGTQARGTADTLDAGGCPGAAAHERGAGVQDE